MRFLVALPVLVAAELIVHARMRPVICSFVERRGASPEDLPRFYVAIDSAVRVRNSVPIEVGLLLLVYILGPFGVARSCCTPLLNPVCDARRTLATNPRRILVRPYQHPHLSVHPPALVQAILYLVPVPVAGLEDQPQSNSDSS